MSLIPNALTHSLCNNYIVTISATSSFLKYFSNSRKAPSITTFLLAPNWLLPVVLPVQLLPLRRAPFFCLFILFYFPRSPDSVARMLRNKCQNGPHHQPLDMIIKSFRLIEINSLLFQCNEGGQFNWIANGQEPSESPLVSRLDAALVDHFRSGYFFCLSPATATQKLAPIDSGLASHSPFCFPPTHFAVFLFLLIEQM